MARLTPEQKEERAKKRKAFIDSIKPIEDHRIQQDISGLAKKIDSAVKVSEDKLETKFKELVNQTVEGTKGELKTLVNTTVTDAEVKLRGYVNTTVGEAEVKLKGYVNTTVGEAEVKFNDYVNTTVTDAEVKLKDYVNTTVGKAEVKFNDHVNTTVTDAEVKLKGYVNTTVEGAKDEVEDYINDELFDLERHVQNSVDRLRSASSELSEEGSIDSAAFTEQQTSPSAAIAPTFNIDKLDDFMNNHRNKIKDGEKCASDAVLIYEAEDDNYDTETEYTRLGCFDRFPSENIKVYDAYGDLETDYQFSMVGEMPVVFAAI